MDRFKDRVVLITGSGSKRGIGHQTALNFAREGGSVALVDLPSCSDNLEYTAHDISQTGKQAFAFLADVTKEDSINKLVENVLGKFNKIDILVNCHGYQGLQQTPLIDYPESEWDKSINVNLTGVFLCCKAIIKYLITRNQGGKIVNVASRGGKIGRPGESAYSASKFGVIGFTQSMALELARYKINVNAVCPNLLATGFSRGEKIQDFTSEGHLSWDEAANKAFTDYIKTVPIGRLCTVDDVASLILFLCSTESEYITGQAINVSGGMQLY